MFKIIAFCIITMFTRLYVSVGILLPYGKQLYDRAISLRGDDFAHKTSLAMTGKWVARRFCLFL